MNATPVIEAQSVPAPPPRVRTAKTPRAPKRKQAPAQSVDASLQELVAEAARLHAEVYVDDASGTIHGPQKTAEREGSGTGVSLHESWGFREAYADALAKSAPASLDEADKESWPNRTHESTSSPTPPDPTQIGVVPRSGFRGLAALRRGLQVAAASLKNSQIWYQQRRLQHLQMKRLRVVETVSLGEKRFISVVQIDGAEFLVGGSSTSIALLGELGAKTKILSAPLEAHSEQCARPTSEQG